jgi:hypothetical protein
MTTDVSPTDSPATEAGPSTGSTSRRLTSPSMLASVGLYAAAAGHVVAALVHLSHGWGITAFFLVTAAVQICWARRSCSRS